MSIQRDKSGAKRGTVEPPKILGVAHEMSIMTKTQIVFEDATITRQDGQSAIEIEGVSLWVDMNGTTVHTFKDSDITVWAHDKPVTVLGQGLHFTLKNGLVTMTKCVDGEMVYSRPIDITALWVDAEGI